MRISVEIGMRENEKRIKFDCKENRLFNFFFCFRKYKLRISAEIEIHEKKKGIRKKKMILLERK